MLNRENYAADGREEIIGKSAIRKDAWSKVTGTAQYTADIPAKGLRYTAVVRSPHHHARILNIDAGAARAIPGVLAVITARDVPGDKTIGSIIPDQPVLAFDRVRHIGEPVVMVIAESKEIAQRAASCVRVDYDPLPAVFDPRAALQADAPQVQDSGNLNASYVVAAGNIEAGFAGADVILEDDFSVQRISPGYMEPENSLAKWNPDGSLTVWVSSQKPFDDQQTIAGVLALPVEKIQVIGAMVGGAFGGKEDASIAVLAALAAYITHSTVLVANDRHESFVAHPKRHPAQIHIKLGAKNDGTLVALQGIVHMDTGAYSSFGPAVGGLLTELVQGAYRIPNVDVQTYVVYTNSPYSGAMRGFGSPQAHFAIESSLDMLAERLGMDPIELRRKNILRPGDSLATRVVVDETANSLPLCLDAVAEARERLGQIPAGPGKASGVGFALAIQSMGLGAKILDQSAHRLEWLPDGRVAVYLGAPDLGQGLTTVSEQMVAAALDLPFDQVVTVPIDTLVTPNGGTTCGSRMTYLAGNALHAAAQQLRQNLITAAAQRLQVSPDDLGYRRGEIIDLNGRRYAASEFSSRAAEDNQPIQAQATATFPYPEETTPQHLPIGMPHVKFTFAAQVARVEVDPLLGTIQVKQFEAIHDVGRVINRAATEGQIEGGISMGIGYALYEDMPLKDNQKWVDSFSEYLLPTTRDMPEQIKITLLEIPEKTGPYGVKGVAEIAVPAAAPAIANAVFAASGKRIKNLPISAEKVAGID